MVAKKLFGFIGYRMPIKLIFKKTLINFIEFLYSNIS